MYDRPSEEEGEHSKSTEPRRSTRTRRPNPKYANAAITKEEIAAEPETFEDAQIHVEWKKAMEEEFAALEQNQTWVLVPKRQM